MRFKKVGIVTLPLLHAILLELEMTGDHFVAFLKPNLGRQTREDSSTTTSSLRVPFTSAAVNSPSIPALLTLALSSSSSTDSAFLHTHVIIPLHVMLVTRWSRRFLRASVREVLGGFGHTDGVGVDGDRVGMLDGDSARGDAEHASLERYQSRKKVWTLAHIVPRSCTFSPLRCQVQVLVIMHNHIPVCKFSRLYIYACKNQRPHYAYEDSLLQETHSPSETHPFNVFVSRLATTTRWSCRWSGKLGSTPKQRHSQVGAPF